SRNGGPTHTPVPPGVGTPAASTRRLPVGPAVSGTVTTAVSTARSGAILAPPTVRPSWRSSRRTSAAAARSEPGEPFRPRVGTRPTPRILPPATSTTSVVAFPTSTPAMTVTRRPPLRGKTAAGVDIRRLGQQRRATRQPAAVERGGQLGQLRGRGPARPQRLVDGQHLVVGQPGQLGRAAQVPGQLRVAVLFRHHRLALQGLRVNPEVGHVNVPRPHRLHGQPVHRFPRQRPHRYLVSHTAHPRTRHRPDPTATMLHRGGPDRHDVTLSRFPGVIRGCVWYQRCWWCQ